MGKRWLSTGDVAAELGVSRHFVIRACKQGWLRFDRAPGQFSHRRISAEALAEYRGSAEYLKTWQR